MELVLIPVSSIACVIIGILLLRRARVRWIKAEKSERWHSTKGKVLRCRVFKAGAAAGTPDVFVTYEYSVGSQKLKGDQLSFWQVSKTDEANELADRFKVGAEIDVFYNPRNPAEAVLVRGRRRDKPFHEFWMAGILGLSGVLLAVGNWEKFETIFNVLVR